MVNKNPAHEIIMREIEDLSQSRGNAFFREVMTAMIELFCDTLRNIIIPREEIPALIERVERLRSSSSPGREKPLAKLKKELEEYLEKGERE